MSKTDEYRDRLRGCGDWDALLRAECRLPGPRANLELLAAVVEEGDADQFRRWASPACDDGSANTPAEFLVVCGVAGYGRLLAEGDRSLIPILRRWANDPRWRVREGVAIGLQRWGDVDMAAVLDELDAWAPGSPLERRAVVAAVAEPRLLRERLVAARAVELLDRITESYRADAERRSDAAIALRKALSYGWSVVVAAAPEAGKPAMERWCACQDPDIRRIMRENLSKARLKRVLIQSAEC